MDRLARFIKNNYVVLAIITVGFFLRSLGLQFGKPFRYHPDEMKLVFQAARLINFQEWSLQTLDGIGFYPPLFTYILAGAYALYALVLLFLGNIPDLPAFAELYKADPFQFHYIARLVSLFSGTITVALVYAVGKRLYTKRSGQIAAGFLAVVFLHVRNSHFGVVDILLTFWVLLAFWASVRILQEGRVKYYLLAGVFAGFAVSTKYNSGLIISVIVLAHFLRTEGGVRGLLRNTIDKKIWIAGAATIVAFLLTCPFPIIDLRTFYAYSAGTVAFESRGKIGSGGDFWSYFTGGTSPGFGFFYDNNFIAALGIAVVLLFSLGAVLLLVRHKKEDILLLLFPVLIYTVVGSMNYKAMRHLLPAAPLLVIFAAECCRFAAERPARRWQKNLLLIALLCSVVVPQTAKSLRYGLALRETDTRTTMKRWIEANLPDGAKIGLEEGGLALLSSEEEHRELMLQTGFYEKAFDLYGIVPRMYVYGGKRTEQYDPREYLFEQGIEYIVLDSFTREKFSWDSTRERYPEIYRQRRDFYKWVQNECRLLYAVSPDKNLNISPALELYRVNYEKISDEK